MGQPIEKSYGQKLREMAIKMSLAKPGSSAVIVDPLSGDGLYVVKDGDEGQRSGFTYAFEALEKRWMQGDIIEKFEVEVLLKRAKEIKFTDKFILSKIRAFKKPKRNKRYET